MQASLSFHWGDLLLWISTEKIFSISLEKNGQGCLEEDGLGCLGGIGQGCFEGDGRQLDPGHRPGGWFRRREKRTPALLVERTSAAVSALKYQQSPVNDVSQTVTFGLSRLAPLERLGCG